MNFRNSLWVACALAVAPVAGMAQDLPYATKLAAATPAAIPDFEARPSDSLRLPRLTKALLAAQKPRVLAIGSSSTVGMGASSPSRNNYAKLLEAELETIFKGTDVIMEVRGMNGEAAEGAAGRMKQEVEATKPDLVIWQVGTNDALRHVEMEGFKNCLRKTLAWLKEQKVDVLLLNPQYGTALVQDAYYEQVVAAIAEVAREAEIGVVDRFGRTRDLHRKHGESFYLTADNLHMNDAGYSDLARQLKDVIIAAVANSAKPVPRAQIFQDRGAPRAFEFNIP